MFDIPALSANTDTNAHCINHQGLVTLVKSEATAKDYGSPVFRVKRAVDGQSLVYWHFGEKTGSFYAVTFKTDGCAILTDEGSLRRFAFPKTAFNTGVFFELDVLKLEP
ncbi:MAG: hypothetical protein AAGA76_11560 [Pseudomonadota bacterium]